MGGTESGRKRSRGFYAFGACMLAVVPAAILLAARTIWLLCPRFFCLLVVVPLLAFTAAAVRRVRDTASRTR
jgi:hypothetical protein